MIIRIRELGKSMELVPELDYRRHVGSLHKTDYPISLKMQSVVLKLGLTYYF